MAHFLRLIASFALIFVVSSPVIADEMPALHDYSVGGSTTYYSTMELAAKARAEQLYATNGCSAAGQYCPVTYSPCSLINSGANWSCQTNASGYNPLIGNVHYYCPSSSWTLSGTGSASKCTTSEVCPAGTTRNPTTGSCDKACESGYVSGVSGSSYFGSDGGTDCLNNCTFQISVSVCATLTSGQGACVGSYGNGTGASCSAASNNTALTPEANCMSQGKSFISVGGVTSCVAAGTSGATPVTTKDHSSSSSSGSTKDANGNTTGTTSGSSTTNSSATFNGDGTVVVVTTTEKTNADGTKETKTETKTVSQTSYCAENPTAAQCKAATDSDISGACDAVACKGDAIQCAMAKEQARRNCEWFKENVSAKALGEAMADDTDTTPNPADSSNRETVNVQSSLDSSSPISASCFTDVTVTLLGQSATLPLSDWCPFFEALGYIFLALSYMAALRIVAGVIV